MNAREDAAQLAALLALEAAGRKGALRNEHSPYAIARDALAIIRLGKRAATLALKQCNGEGHWHKWPDVTTASGTTAGGWGWAWDDADEERSERARAKVKAKAEELLKPYGAPTVTVHGDPRGAVMRIHFKSGRKNGMGDGWGL